MWADPIDRRYLLVINILHYKNADGTDSVDELWHKDLQLHRYYLKDLRVASPRRPGEAPPSTRVLEDGEGMGPLTHVGLPDIPSKPRTALSTPQTLARLWKAISEAEVVHVGVGGWPYPLGWPAALFARMQKKFLITVVESAPHRQGFLPGAPLGKKLYGHFHEKMARWAVNLADFSIFTQDEYRTSMHRSGKPYIVTNATWIDEATVLSDADAERSWDEKPSPPLRLIFAGSLVPSKGLRPLMEAVRKLAEAGLDLRVDIIGQGLMHEECKAFAASLPDGPTKVSILPQVPYGPEFFAILRRYHAVLVPSVADEQPRIVYDAYSQAVPVIGSDTAGIRDCVTDGENGILLPPGDVDALAGAITRAAEDPSLLRSLGLRSLARARKTTHVENHRVRHELLKTLFPKSGSGTAQGDAKSPQPVTQGATP